MTSGAMEGTLTGYMSTWCLGIFRAQPLGAPLASGYHWHKELRLPAITQRDFKTLDTPRPEPLQNPPEPTKPNHLNIAVGTIATLDTSYRLVVQAHRDRRCDFRARPQAATDIPFSCMT